MESMSTAVHNNPIIGLGHTPPVTSIFSMSDSLELQIQNERHIISTINQCILRTRVQLLATKAYSHRCSRVVRETEERYLKALSALEHLEMANSSFQRLAERAFANESISQSLEQHTEASAQTLIDLRARVATWENAEGENRDKAKVRAAEVAAVLRGEEEEVTTLELSLMRAEQRLSVKEALLNALSP